jgi:NADH:flavin oxidoreductase / NADH oxidase family
MNDKSTTAEEAVGPERAGSDHDREVAETNLLSPLTLRGINLRHRIVMSPMCQYCAEERHGQ